MLSALGIETGQLAGTYPYVRLGNGPKTLLVIPGLSDAMFDGTYGRSDALLYRRAFRHALENGYAVYVVSRPRGLGDNQSIAAMARDYATVLESIVGSASVLGLSLGGLIGQELARLRPELVDRLVVAVAGCRLAASGRPIVRELRGHALEREWSAIRARLDEAMYTGVRRQVYPRYARTAGRLRPPTPAVAHDVVASIDAVLEYDASDRLDEIGPRTLVIGGAEDPFFPEEILRETHAGLPDSQLALFRDGRHGVFRERKTAFDTWVGRFLDGREEAARARRQSV